MPLDPNIILGIGDLNNPDRAAQAKLNALKVLSAQREEKGQNALRAMFANPQNFDPSTGGLTPNALRMAGAEGGADFYYTLAQNNLNLQKTQAELTDKYMGMIDDAGLPAALAYDSTLKSTGSKEAAQKAAQTAWDSARKDLTTSGHLPGEIADKLPNQFNPDLFKAKSKQYQAFAKEQLGEEKEKFMEGLDLAKLGQGQERINIQVGKEKQGGFSDEMGDLMAALAEKGVSLPTGFRSKAQQVELYKGLLARNPDKTPDEIADMVKKGQIEFGAQKKETQVAAGIAGKVEVFANELEQFAPLVAEASKAVPRGRFMPINRLLQAGEGEISDPNLRTLKIYINSLLNAYDGLAARGGTDIDKRAQVRSLLTSADSPEVIEKNLPAFLKEAQAAHRAAIAATKVPELTGEAEKGTGNPKKIGRFTVIEVNP